MSKTFKRRVKSKTYTSLVIENKESEVRFKKKIFVYKPY